MMFRVVIHKTPEQCRKVMTWAQRLIRVFNIDRSSASMHHFSQTLTGQRGITTTAGTVTCYVGFAGFRKVCIALGFHTSSTRHSNTRIGCLVGYCQMKFGGSQRVKKE
jgi:hypothetical protein